MLGSEEQNNSNRRLGAFVTNKYLVSVLVALLISAGGYIFTLKDNSQAAQAADIASVISQVNQQRDKIVAIEAREAVTREDVLRRLDRIERTVDNIVIEVRRVNSIRRSESP